MSVVASSYFYLCGLLAVFGALVAVAAANPIRAAMGLLTMILSVAGLFLALHAQFLAAIQLIVYAGAIVVLFLFVIMLLGPSARAPRDNRGTISRTIFGVIFGITAVAAMVFAARAAGQGTAHIVGTAMPLADNDFGSIDAFARALFSEELVPFELSSALLMVSVIGAVAVARGNSTRKETLAAERLRVSRQLALEGRETVEAAE